MRLIFFWRIAAKMTDETKILTKNQLAAIDELEDLAEKTAPPLQYLEHSLTWLGFLFNNAIICICKCRSSI
jgi:hypothetical protein